MISKNELVYFLSLHRAANNWRAGAGHVVRSNMFFVGHGPFLAGQILTVVTLAILSKIKIFLNESGKDRTKCPVIQEFVRSIPNSDRTLSVDPPLFAALFACSCALIGAIKLDDDDFLCSSSKCVGLVRAEATARAARGETEEKKAKDLGETQESWFGWSVRGRHLLGQERQKWGHRWRVWCEHDECRYHYSHLGRLHTAKQYTEWFSCVRRWVRWGEPWGTGTVEKKGNRLAVIKWTTEVD